MICPIPELTVNNLLIVLSAPSGAGKTTLCEQLLKIYPNLTRAVTCTTRAPRENEIPNRDYYFLSADEFLKRVQAGEFLEHATVYGNSYGTLRSEVIHRFERGKDVILTVDVQGAETIRRKTNEDPTLREALVTVFLTPPSLEELGNRLKNRDSDSAEAVQRRLGTARHEIQSWRKFDYLLISQSREVDLSRMRMILEAEKMKQRRISNTEGFNSIFTLDGDLNPS